MSNNNIEQMKKLIEEKKRVSSEQGSTEGTRNKKIGSSKKVFKKNKKGRALSK